MVEEELVGREWRVRKGGCERWRKGRVKGEEGGGREGGGDRGRGKGERRR